MPETIEDVMRNWTFRRRIGWCRACNRAPSVLIWALRRDRNSKYLKGLKNVFRKLRACFPFVVNLGALSTSLLVWMIVRQS